MHRPDGIAAVLVGSHRRGVLSCGSRAPRKRPDVNTPGAARRVIGGIRCHYAISSAVAVILKRILSSLSARFALAGLAALICATAAAQRPPNKLVVGAVEPVEIHPFGLRIDARVDTGATISSIDAHNIRRVRRDGESWMEFEVRTSDGKSHRIEARLLRISRITGAGGDSERRSVVALTLCVADVLRVSDVTLADRHGMEFAALIGREFLAGQMVVDPALRKTTTPHCKAPAA